jgi:hypothetical protein
MKSQSHSLSQARDDYIPTSILAAWRRKPLNSNFEPLSKLKKQKSAQNGQSSRFYRLGEAQNFFDNPQNGTQPLISVAYRFLCQLYSCQFVDHLFEWPFFSWLGVPTTGVSLASSASIEM